jgi:hypothetical protein
MEQLGPRFATKVAVVLREDLAPWQRLNAAAFLSSGIAAGSPALIGEPYVDADGTTYLAMFGQPVLVFEGGKEELRAAYERAVRRDLRLAIFTSDLFHTGHDEANRAAVARVSGADLDLVGLAVHGPRNAVDKVVKGCRLHP